MTEVLPPAAQHVQDFLRRAGSFAHVQLLPESTATAEDAAKALGVSISEIGKSIVFGNDDNVLVVVVCGDQRVDGQALSKRFGSDVKPLKADIVKARTGYSIGGVSPYGLPPDIRIVVDMRIQSFSACYVAAGHPKAIVLTSGRELVALTDPVLDVVAIHL